jgi:hypothetical protein
LNEKYVTFHNPYDQHRIMRNGPGNWTDLGEFKMSDTLGIYRHRELNQPDVMSMRISVPGLTNIFSKKPYESLSVQLGDIQLFHLFKEYETAFAEVIIDGYRTARIFHNEMYDAANEGLEYNVGFPPKGGITVFNAGRGRSVQIVSLLVDGMDYKLKHPDYAALLSEYYYLYSSYQSNINNNLLEVSRVILPASGDTTVSMPSPGCNMLSCTWNKPSGAVAAVPDTENFLMPFLPVPLLLTS